MNLILWLVIGGILGWIASLVMHTNAQQGLILNIVVGIVGALLAGVLLAPLLDLEWRRNRAQPAPVRPPPSDAPLAAGARATKAGTKRRCDRSSGRAAG